MTAFVDRTARPASQIVADQDHVRASLDRISKVNRQAMQALVLRYRYAYTAEEIARILDVKLYKVYELLNLASTVLNPGGPSEFPTNER